jgi:hypothetical protein
VPRGREIATFAVLVIACSVAIGAILHPLVGGNSLIAAGVASVILCARGFGWGRKIAFAAIVLLGFGAFQRWYDLLGITVGGGFAAEFDASVLGMIYIVFMMAFPLVVLMLFVGRDPSALWTPARTEPKERSRQRGPRSR